MPRLPIGGDKNGVYEYRITLGSLERELLRDATEAYSLNKVAQPITNILGNPVALISVSTLILTLFPNILGKLPDWLTQILDDPNIPPEEKKGHLDGYLRGFSALGGLIGFFTGGPVGGAAGAVTGELLDDTIEDSFEQAIPFLTSLLYQMSLIGNSVINSNNNNSQTTGDFV